MSALTKISLVIVLAGASAPAFAGMNGSDWINRARPAASAQSALDARAEIATSASSGTPWSRFSEESEQIYETLQQSRTCTYQGGPKSGTWACR
ncbi:MAG: hypothetical protein HZA66_05535 [Rhodopseudomonas palustris]|uniref:Uncharacterized protein n=1 Tax=Rhodopseudomonas palustris TaxID=1076 RepID=A0A933RYM9_RHOPL|nr:hypothetical protein [Rhodopseudomonas palustris]